MSELFPLVFGAMFVAVIVWFFLLKRFYNILESRHPEKYDAMGRPTLFFNNRPSSTFQLMKFLFTGEWRALRDPGLASLSKFMVLYTIVYLVCFIIMVASIHVNT